MSAECNNYIEFSFWDDEKSIATIEIVDHITMQWNVIKESISLLDLSGLIHRRFNCTLWKPLECKPLFVEIRLLLPLVWE